MPSYLIIKKIMERESDYDNDGLDPSEEYFRKKRKGNDEDFYFPPEESEPPHYWLINLLNKFRCINL